ncbi:hypothetical protein FJ959_22370 [Mesorhizobium sp. B2-2-4]|uniref:hypothetical protein n=1 Tax=unclassified Mesorhizobium TaxID=325217 RepID=UPI00112CCED6|nr:MULTISPECIES: hypothetical protein [unclassified Mesorhizobium]TPM53276.1 hypothetical protein FJ959_22370 [Mesorhizobium sp. B2-2-4]TPM62080.1 hypothetical protein FJ965_20995 [Mesorhizobium sp. B2-2-1]TPN68451.1 hypothetical protein FJ984_11475 [Mesorhizobium sp. B1-1-3]
MARPATAAVRLLTGEREPVRLATTANIDVDAGGLLTIDGVQTEVGDRVLVKDQSDGSENGIRTVSTGQWYRAADSRTARTMQKGTTVHVQEGTANQGKTFVFNTLDPVVGDTSLSIVFYQSDDTIGEVNGAIAAGLVTISAAEADAIVAIEEAGADVTAIKPADTNASGFGFVIDEDDMVSNSASKVPTQQSVKAYADLKLAKTSNLADLPSKPDARGNLAVPVYVSTRTAMKALTPTKDLVAILYEAGREGTFVLKAGSPPVTDTQEGVYVVSNTAGFYWKRIDAAPDITVFGAVQDGVTLDDAAIQGSLDVLGYANVLEWKGSAVKVNNIRLKDVGNLLQGFGWPKLISSAGTVLNIENSYQTVQGLMIDGTLQTTGLPVIRIKTDLRGMTTVNIKSLYLINCGAGIMDMNNGANLALFVNIRDITMEGHRGYGIATWDCWASYHIDQVVVSRVGKTGTAYNSPAFYFNGAEGIFFRNCAHNGSAATSVQALQDGAVFDNCNFVVFTNFIPDHSGGRGLVFLSCNNVRGGDSTLVNSVDHGFVVSGGSLFSISDVLATQLATIGLAAKDGFNLTGTTTFKGKGLAATGYTRNGFLADACTKLNVMGDFSLNTGRGIVTTGASSANLFHGCLTASNTAGNYSLVSASDYLRDHMVSAGTLADVTGPATA